MPKFSVVFCPSILTSHFGCSNHTNMWPYNLIIVFLLTIQDALTLVISNSDRRMVWYHFILQGDGCHFLNLLILWWQLSSSIHQFHHYYIFWHIYFEQKLLISLILSLATKFQNFWSCFNIKILRPSNVYFSVHAILDADQARRCDLTD